MTDERAPGFPLLLAASLAAALVAGPATAEWSRAMRLSEPAAAASTTLNFAHALAADARGGVHAVWYESDERGSRVRYRRSLDGGLTWDASRVLSGEEDAEHPSLALADGRVFVAWQGADASDRGQVLLRASRDRGASWEDAVEMSGGAVAHPSLARGGQTLHLVWVDSRSGEAEVYYRRSPDRGESWGEERRLTDAPFASWTPSLAASEELVVLAWVDARDGNEEEYVKVSGDGGLHWGEDRRLTHERKNSWAPSVAVAGRTIHLVWFDQMHNEFHLLDAEAELDEALRLVGVEPEAAPAGVLVPDPLEPGALTFYSRALQLRVDRKTALLRERVPGWVEGGGDPRRIAELMAEFNRRLWVASRDWEICYLRSDDGGATWSDTVRLTAAEGASSRPNLAVVGDTLHLVWFDDRFGSPEIFYKSSLDGGRTWTQDERLTETPRASERPMAAGSAGAVHVIWRDESAGLPQVYYLRGGGPSAKVPAP